MVAVSVVLGNMAQAMDYKTLRPKVGPPPARGGQTRRARRR